MVSFFDLRRFLSEAFPAGSAVPLCLIGSEKTWSPTQNLIVYHQLASRPIGCNRIRVSGLHTWILHEWPTSTNWISATVMGTTHARSTWVLQALGLGRALRCMERSVRSMAMGCAKDLVGMVELMSCC